ncbi:MAG TPA: 4-hydroxyphenylacetate 3-hydroxylase N-terminal domain-containing protein [Microbacteriaceae bacterium]|nr:4-hydroxyphenylacetate 3-hydroxylase N-terminal domain-containing protein [Microbacteriaceae bacterium]
MTDSVQRPMNGAEYLESLRDGREVYAYGELVEDVTTHPAFELPTRTIARMYDSLHDPASGMVTVPTDTGNGGYTHPFFKMPTSVEELRQSRDAIAHWARMSYGWMGRTPDYKASFLGVLKAEPDFYSPYQENAARWYRESQEKVLYWNHALVNPPIDRHLSIEEGGDVVVHVERETDAGLILSGAKVVATGSAMTHMTFLAHSGAPLKDKRFAIVAAVPMNAPGLKLISRASYAQTASQSSSPFDHPLSSRFDENDPILVLDQVFVPWENVFMYGDLDKTFATMDGFGERAAFHGAIRLATKLDFIVGLLMKSLDLTGTKEFRGVQARLGEAVAWRSMIWSLVEAMVSGGRVGEGGAVNPNLDAVNAYRWFGDKAYTAVRDIVMKDLGSALIYLPSSSKDFASPRIRPYLDKYVRGSGGHDAEDRVKTLKLLWDAVGTEFAGRHDLYERNYMGNHELIRLFVYGSTMGAGTGSQLIELAEQAMSEYDLNGWTLPEYQTATQEDHR